MTKVKDINYTYRTYRISLESVSILERFAREISSVLGTKMSANMTADMLIKSCKDLSFADIIKKNSLTTL